MKTITATAAAVLCAASAATAGANDLTLRFDRPADFFEETFVLGNGTQGAIVYGNPSRERISLNDITFWTGQPDTAVFSPGAYKAIPDIRAALNRGDYKLAEELQRQVQGHYTENYQPVGNLIIDFADKSPVTSYERTLDLNTANARINYTRPGNAVTTECLASSPDSVIAVRITSAQPIDLTLSFESQVQHTVTSAGNRITADGCASLHTMPSYVRGGNDGLFKYEEGKTIAYRTAITAQTSDGTVTASPDGTLTVKGTTGLTLYVNIATNFGGAGVHPSRSGIDQRAKADRLADKASAAGFDAIRSRQQADYAALFGRVSLDLGDSDPALAAMTTDARLKNYTDTHAADPDLEELYFQFGRYLLISCSRTPGVPANLQGLWNESLLPPWSSNYTTNINVEENYWPAETTNLSELHMPLLGFIAELPRTGRDTAREYYGVQRGWCLGHNSDIWAMTNPVGLHGGSPMWANWNMGGAWIATHIWEHWLFSKDRGFLKEYWPVLRGAAEFCLDWLTEDKEGYLVTSPSTSPENTFKAPDGTTAATCTGGYADIAMIRECLADARAAALELGTDAALVAEIDAALPRLAPYRTGAAGQLQEWDLDYPESDPQHRHQSHLFGLFPGHHITLDETPETAAACARTLAIKGENTTGWSTGWRVSLLARLADSAHAYSMYRRLLKYVTPDGYKGEDARRGGGTYPNLLDAHSPFQIDGNFGGTAGVAEMLLQSTPESITLLPAIPGEWKEGAFKGLRARGAYTVDAEWHDGRLTALTVTSDAGGNTTLHANGLSIPLDFAPGQTRHFTF